MTSGWLAAMIALSPVALAPLAHAQDCAPLERVIAAGGTAKFVSLMGAPLGDGQFETDISFFDAEECAIDSILSQYVCMWDGADVAEGDKAIAPLYDMAKVCLSGPWEWTEIAGQKTGTGTLITEGYAMTRTRQPHKGAVVRVYMDSKPGAAWRQVWLEVE
jgi:hypothetical protein